MQSLPDEQSGQFRLPSVGCLFVGGGSLTGKSTAVRELLENHRLVFERPFQHLVLAMGHGDVQQYERLLRMFKPSSRRVIETFDAEQWRAMTFRPGSVFVVDDFVVEVGKSPWLEHFVTRGASRAGVLLVLISQMIHSKTLPYLATALKNAETILLPVHLRNRMSAANMSIQIFGNSRTISTAFDLARKNAVRYLIVNMSPRCDDRLRLTGNRSGAADWVAFVENDR